MAVLACVHCYRVGCARRLGCVDFTRTYYYSTFLCLPSSIIEIIFLFNLGFPGAPSAIKISKVRFILLFKTLVKRGRGVCKKM